MRRRWANHFQSVPRLTISDFSQCRTRSAVLQHLAKAVEVVAILASALSQEYGSGINFVLTSSLGTYPKVTYLVPLAMVVAGLLLLPKVILFMRSYLRVSRR